MYLSMHIRTQLLVYEKHIGYIKLHINKTCLAIGMHILDFFLKEYIVCFVQLSSEICSSISRLVERIVTKIKWKLTSCILHVILTKKDANEIMDCFKK
jgi:hypothetical protein